MNVKSALLCVCAAFMVGACAETGMGRKQGAGTILGAAAGGIIGNQFGGGTGRVLTTATGVVVGGLIGNQIGRSLDEAERRSASEAEYAALEHGRAGAPVKWQSASNGNSGEVIPGPAYTVNSSTCRDYMHTIYIDGREQRMRGTACREEDGTWRAIT